MDAYLSSIFVLFTSFWWLFLLTAVIAYLLGSVNPAVIFTRIATKGKVDIRTVGSGNAGFTNVLRSVGKVPAILTLLFDVFKGVIAVLIGGFIFSAMLGSVSGVDNVLQSQFINLGKYIAGIFCIIGHSYPLYFHFKGGKGVLSAAALMLTEDWRVFLIILGIFLIVFMISRIISLASITCAVFYGPCTFFVTFVFDYLNSSGFYLSYVIMSTAAALIIGTFVFVKHKENIKRLLRGEEKKITAKK